MAELTNGFEALEELGAFELAGSQGDKSLSEKDVKTLKVLVGQVEHITSEMKKMYDAAHTESIDACIDNVGEIKAVPAMEDFYTLMPEKNYQKQVEHIVGGLSKDVADKFLVLDKKQQIAVMAAAPENVSFFWNKGEYEGLEEKLVSVYGKITQDFPEMVYRTQDSSSHEMLAEYLTKGNRKILDDAWQTDDLDKRLEAVKTISQKMFSKENRDYPFKRCSETTGIAGYYDRITDFGVVAEDLLKFPDWSVAMLVTVHENQHRQQELQIKKIKLDSIEKDTPEYFQARLFKSNFEGGYLVSFVKKTELEKTANIVDYVSQPVEVNANKSGYAFTKHFSLKAVAQDKDDENYAVSESKKAKEELKKLRERDPESLTRKPINDEYRKAGLFSLMNGKSR
ncbi:MAG: hypothetical protein AB7U85_03155 [Alphaproteobacteria bacterium]